MKISRVHGWNLTPEAAQELQAQLRQRVVLEPCQGAVRLAAGADCGYDEEKKRVIASVVLLEVPSLRIVEKVTGEAPLLFPYIPGLLSFREAPALIAAFRNLKTVPDVAFFDAQGIAHPRRFGLACHMGLWLDMPTIGVAKSLLVGTHDTPARGFGSFAVLRFEGEEVGAAFRAAKGAVPVYVSPGHRMDIKSAVRLTRAVSDGFPVPFPTRVADREVRKLIK